MKGGWNWRRGLALAVGFGMLFGLQSSAWSQATARQEDENRAQLEEEYVAGEILIKFRPRAGRLGIQNALHRLGAQEIGTLPAIGVRHWRLGMGVSVEQAVDILTRPPFKDTVEYAEPNYIGRAHGFPNDPLRGDLYGLHNIGQTGGTKDADIDAPEAWDVERGSTGVVVGVLDTGVDYLHGDLASNIWVNPGEDLNGNGVVDSSDFNGVDDDNNGYVDDLRGWDFRNHDNDPMDDNSHGSHVAGTIGALGNNGIGVAGVCWSVRLMPLKWISASGTGTAADAAAALIYAASFKDASGNPIVRVTNNSYGFGSPPKTLQDAIAASGALTVCSAGNDGSTKKQYPAGFALDNILSVAATDDDDLLASFSNYSSDWVDLGAPGVGVLSTTPSGTYNTKSGTSMSAPHVAGAVALVLSHFPGYSNAALKAALLDSVDPKPSLAGKTLTGGRLNVRAAVGAAEFPPDSLAPAGLTDLLVTGVTSDTVSLSFTATGDDGSAGTAYLQDVRYLANDPITESNWASATAASGESLPKAAGSPEAFKVTGLKGGTTYYLALKVSDEAGNVSIPSNVVSATTNASLWTTEIVDAAGDVGFYNALAFAPDGNPSVGYLDSTNADVRFAHWNGTTWVTEIVDGATSTSSAPDLAYDPTDGNPSLSYGPGKLKFVHWNGSSWTIEVVESTYAGGGGSLVFDPLNRPTIAYQVGGRNAALKFARKTASGWSREVVDAGKHAYLSLAYDPAGNPAIGYSDDVDGDGWLDTLMFAHWNGSSWDIQVVETGTIGYGVFASLAYDPVSGRPALVHRAGGTVRFLLWNGSTWDLEIVDATSPYFAGCSLGYAPGGTAYVSYVQGFDVGPEKLKVARKVSTGVWEAEVVDEGDFGSFTSLKFAPDGKPALSYNDYGARDCRYAKRN